MRRICFVLLLCLLPMLGACLSYPRYQPIPASSSWSFPPIQGYRDVQIDKQTFLIFYESYITRKLPLLGDPLDEKWLQGAQEYTLYRAAEFAKSKGARHFVVLYKDDWNLLDISSHRSGKYSGYRSCVEPGAGLVIRLLNKAPTIISQSDERVYEVDRLLQNLTEKNRGLAHYQNNDSPEESMKHAKTGFRRWRSLVSEYDYVPVPGHWMTRLFGREHIFEPGSTISKGSAGEFQIAAWEDTFRPLSPVQFLWQCVTLTRQEGLTAFKLLNWTVEERRTSRRFIETPTVWFRTKADLIPQSEKDPDSLEPVFRVDELLVNNERASEHQ